MAEQPRLTNLCDKDPENGHVDIAITTKPRVSEFFAEFPVILVVLTHGFPLHLVPVIRALRLRRGALVIWIGLYAHLRSGHDNHGDNEEVEVNTIFAVREFVERLGDLHIRSRNSPVPGVRIVVAARKGRKEGRKEGRCV